MFNSTIRWIAIALPSLLVAIQTTIGDEVEPASQEGKAVQTGSLLYKKEPRRRMAIYYPEGWQATDRRAAMVIFRCRIPYQRERFRQLGMVVIEPQTAPVNSGKLPSLSLDEIAKLPKPRHQVEDAKSAVRFIRVNAKRLGVNPNRIVATGTSGGGDLALQAAINTAFNDPNDDLQVSPVPDALVLYCPAFDGLNIWFVKMQEFVKKTKAEAPAFVPLLLQFVKNTSDEYATPLHHRADAIELAAELGEAEDISPAEIENFQEVLRMFNQRDWQLLHPVEDAKRMSASRILTQKPLPPTMILLGERDHLLEHQMAFLEKAKSLGQKFDVEVYKAGGHSFMMQSAFQEPSTDRVERFLLENKIVDR